MLNSKEKAIACGIVLALVLVAWIGMSWLFQVVWNFLGRDVFHFMPQIEFWHSAGILLFLSILGSIFRGK